MILNIDPVNCGDKVVIKRGNKVIYTVLKHAFYRLPIFSILFWRDLVRNLKSRGFQPNPYDPYVMNKVVDGNCYTAFWHLDYLNISHRDSIVLNDILQRP